MTKAKTALIVVIIVAVAFLSGLLVGYLELRETNAELEQLRIDNQLSDLRERAAMVYLEAARQNFGLASENAGLYFSQLQAMSESNSTLPAERRDALRALLTRRDEIISALAKGEATAAEKARDLYFDTRVRSGAAQDR